MANIKELKVKIKSTKGTFKITSAMKLVSAAKLARAQSAVVGARPYANELNKTIKIISALSRDYSHPYFKENKENNKAYLLVISANKGLCGGYNSSLTKKIKQFLLETKMDVKVHFLGKKVRELLENKVNKGNNYLFKKQDPDYEELREVAEGLAQDFLKGMIGKIFVAYNVFHSAIQFESEIKQVLPMTVSKEEKEKLQQDFPFDFKYEPEPEDLMGTLIPEAYINTVYTCFLDALASEHGSRMSSMDSAANNCKDMIKSLTLKANKLRQAAITTELTEVVSGAESLKG